VYSPGAVVERSSAHGSYREGFRITNSPSLVLTGNAADGNRSTGIRIEKSAPFGTVADVTAAANTASGNQTDFYVAP
jgi:hypothetical protein